MYQDSIAAIRAVSSSRDFVARKTGEQNGAAHVWEIHRRCAYQRVCIQPEVLFDDVTVAFEILDFIDGGGDRPSTVLNHRRLNKGQEFGYLDESRGIRRSMFVRCRYKSWFLALVKWRKR